jgi:hypothetical protein
MSSSQRKKPSSPHSRSSRTKRKPTKSASKTKALVTKAEHVRRQKLNSDKASGTKKKSSNDGVGETLEVLAPALAGPSGLPREAMPDIRLESGRYWPAPDLAGAQRRAEQTLAARSSRVPAGDSQARNAA